MSPRLQRIRTQPTPERDAADLGDEAAREYFGTEFRK